MRISALQAITLIFVCCMLAACAGAGLTRTDQLLSSLREQSDKEPDNVDVHADLAELYVKKYDETKQISFLSVAANELKEVVRLRPDSYWAHAMLARVFFQLRNDDPALFEAQESVRLRSDYAPSRRTLGTIYYSKALSGETCGDNNMVDFAITEFKEAIKLDPDNAYSHSMLGSLYSVKGLHDLNVFEQKEAVRLSPNPTYYRDLGNALHLKGDCEGAIAQYTEALRLKPDFRPVHTELAWVYFTLKRNEDTLKENQAYTQSSKAASPSDPLALLFPMFRPLERRSPPTPYTLPYGNALLAYIAMNNLGQADGARKMLEDYAAKFRGREYQSALLQYYLGHINKAEVEAKTKDPCEQAIAFFFIGYLHVLKGDKKTAVDYFRKTLDARTSTYFIQPAARVLLEELRLNGKD